MIDMAPRIVVGDTVHTHITHAVYEVVIETSDPTGLSYANPIQRFKELRVGFHIELSCEQEGEGNREEDEEDLGQDGACSPSLALFEPLIPGTDHYHLPWFTPAQLSLKDTGLWGGWSAWLGNDNLMIEDCELSFLGATATHIGVRWTGRLSDGRPFLFEGPLAIHPMRVYGPGAMDVQALLKRIFGSEQAQRLAIRSELLGGFYGEDFTAYHLSVSEG
jgi:hypothetical protein